MVFESYRDGFVAFFVASANDSVEHVVEVFCVDGDAVYKGLFCERVFSNEDVQKFIADLVRHEAMKNNSTQTNQRQVLQMSVANKPKAPVFQKTAQNS